MAAQTVQLLDRFGRPFSAQDTAHFGASQRAREFASWTPGLPSADAALLDEAPTLASRAQDLERNHGIAAGMVRTNVDNIVGTGLRLNARPDWRALGWTKERADAWSRDVESKWRSFANVPEFDAARQLTFGGMTVLQMRSVVINGEALGLPQWLPGRPGAKWSTAVQAIDPARLSNPIGTVSGARLRNGVEINDFEEPIAYHIRRSHPFDVYSGLSGDMTWERVPARTSFGRLRVLHMYEKLTPGQSRGRSMLASVMGAFRMLDHYQRIELQTAVVNSMIAAFIETPLKADEIADLFGSDKAYMASRAGWEVKLEGAGVIPLHPGDKLSPFTPTRPNSAYSAFVEAILRYIGTGLNMPYELLMKDFSKTTYSSARAAMLEAWRYFTAMREWLATSWCSPVYALWLEEAVRRGEVEAPGFDANRAAYCAAEWIGPGRGWVDPMKEAQAAGERMRNGVSTLAREAAEQGQHWEEVLQQRATENAMAEELGLPPVHTAPPQGGAPGMQPAAAPAERDEPDDPEDPERPDGAEGDDPIIPEDEQP